MSADTTVERELDAIEAALAGRAVEPDLADLAALAVALREERAPIDPFFSRELDSRAAAGFPRDSSWRRLFSANPLLVPGFAASVLLALAVSAVVLAPGGGDDASTAGGGGSYAGSVTEEQSGSSQAADSAGSSNPAPPAAIGAAAPAARSGSPRSDRRLAREVETSASLLLATPPGRVQRTADEVVAITDRQRGFVVTSSVDVVAGGGGAAFELRVPSARLKATLADLSRLGGVRERREATQDITAQSVSARSRLADARAERKGLLGQLARAVTDLEREAVKTRLRRVSFRIRAAKSDLARVDNRARFSTITLTIAGEPGAGEEEEGAGAWTPGDAARDAVRVLEVAVGVGLIALAVAVPAVLLLALGLMAARVATRRRRERALDVP